jgi:hypothetical protein
MTLLYSSGLYLVLMGLYSLLNDSDIYIGFLWVIDLGVGLIFFIFMLHFLPYLHQKTKFNFTNKHFFVYNLYLSLAFFYFYILSFNIDNSSNSDLEKFWFFRVNYLDYYNLAFAKEVTELNLLRETYFLVSSFEFFLINFSLFYGLVAAILLCFLVHRVFNFLNYSQIKNLKSLLKLSSSFFIRNQDFVNQSNTAAAVLLWARKMKA